MTDYLRRNTITRLDGHHYDTRGIVREGVSPIDSRVNTGPLSMEQKFVDELSDGAEIVFNLDRRPYVSIDIETTDTDYDWGQVLEFGAVIDDWVTPIEKLPRFHAYLVHDRIQGAPKALAMNAKILDRIADRDKDECAHYTFIEPKNLAGMFEFWAKAWGAFGSGGSGQSLIPAGKNFQGFDRPFLKKLERFGRVNMLHRCIDPSMLYWNPAKDQQPPSTKECYERAGITDEVAHTAVEDAIGIIKLIRHKSAQVVMPDATTVAIEPPPAARELAHKLSETFRHNRQFTGQQ